MHIKASKSKAKFRGPWRGWVASLLVALAGGSELFLRHGAYNSATSAATNEDPVAAQGASMAHFWRSNFFGDDPLQGWAARIVMDLKAANDVEEDPEAVNQRCESAGLPGGGGPQ